MFSKLSLASAVVMGQQALVTDFTKNSKTCSVYGGWYSDFSSYEAAENKAVKAAFETLIEIDKNLDKVEACYKACVHAASSSKHGCCMYSLSTSFSEFHSCSFYEAASSTTYGTPLADPSSSSSYQYSSYAW